MTDLERLQIEVDACAHLEAGVRGIGKPTDVYPDWVYEAREAIRRQNANPPPWLADLLAALGWQGGTIHNALSVVRRLVAVSKGEHAAATFREAHPADDAEPVTASWLADVLADYAARLALTGAPGEQQIPCRFGRLTLGVSGGGPCLWLNGELLWTDRHAAHYRMVRGDVRRLFAALQPGGSP